MSLRTKSTAKYTRYDGHLAPKKVALFYEVCNFFRRSHLLNTSNISTTRGEVRKVAPAPFETFLVIAVIVLFLTFVCFVVDCGGFLVRCGTVLQRCGRWHVQGGCVQIIIVVVRCALRSFIHIIC